MIDDLIDRFGIAPDRVQQFLSRYFAARRMSTTAGAKPVTTEGHMPLSAVRLAELCKANPTHQATIVEMFAADKEESEVLAALAAAETADLRASILSLSKERDDLAAQLTKAKADHATELAAKATELGAVAKERDDLKKLGAGALKDPGHTDPEKKQEGKPKFTAQQQSEGKIPADVLKSGAWELIA